MTAPGEGEESAGVGSDGAELGVCAVRGWRGSTPGLGAGQG